MDMSEWEGKKTPPSHPPTPHILMTVPNQQQQEVLTVAHQLMPSLHVVHTLLYRALENFTVCPIVGVGSPLLPAQTHLIPSPILKVAGLIMIMMMIMMFCPSLPTITIIRITVIITSHVWRMEGWVLQEVKMRCTEMQRVKWNSARRIGQVIGRCDAWMLECFNDNELLDPRVHLGLVVVGGWIIARAAERSWRLCRSNPRISFPLHIIILALRCWIRAVSSGCYYFSLPPSAYQ